MPSDSPKNHSENLEAEDIKSETNTNCRKCCKFFSIGVVMLIFMASLCSAQIFTFHLSMRLGALSNTKRSANGTNISSTSVKNDRMEATRIYIIIVLAIITPYFFNFLRALLIISGRTNIRCPNGRIFLWGFLSAALESVGVALLVLYTFTFYNGVECSLIICFIPALPSFVLMVHSTKCDKSKYRCLKMVLTFLSGVGYSGAVGMVIWMTIVTHAKYNLRWIQPCVAVIFLWVAWLSPFQKWSMEFRSDTEKKPTSGSEEKKPKIPNRSSVKENTKTGSDEERPESEGNHSSAISENGNTCPKQESKGENYSKGNTELIMQNHCRNTEAAWMMALISNLFKTIFVIFVAAIIFCKGNLIYSSGTSLNVIWEEFKLAWKPIWTHDVRNYTLLITSSFVAHRMSLFLCHISKSILLFLIPAYFSNVFILAILWCSTACNFFLPETPDVCGQTVYPTWAVIIATVAIALATSSSLFVLGIGRKHVLLQRESQIVWLPSFSSVAPGVWTILNKRMWPLDKEQEVNVERQETAQIFICTTMYRETRKEMTKLFESFKNIITSMPSPESADSGRYVFHIVVDDGARGNDLTRFSLQLLSLITPILGISLKDFTKIIQPYGLKLELKTSSSFNTSLNIHFKDNDKVKKKKRWSQIMYMEFIINYLQPKEEEAEKMNRQEEGRPEGKNQQKEGKAEERTQRKEVDRYILTTDADVSFDRDSVETLVDLMIRDKSVGAVTGRIHPAGSGLCVWYQVFEYAIGHWLQKTADHKLGSVLCAPGCFSLFRSDALKTVLSKYSSDVSCGFDFLTKDMGEDRWLCTLLIQTGWKVEYCAASNSKTFCPVTFGELYNQRRRWVASTLANMWLLIKDYKKLRRPMEKQLSYLFLLYQGIILYSSLIGPSTVIMVVAGGLQLAWGINPILSIVVQSIICLGYVILCLNKSLDRRHQITVARCLTLFYGVAMSAVAVGTIKSIVHEVALAHENDMVFNIPVSATTIYVITLVGIFLLTSLLHWDLACLFYGIFYFLCIPSGYLVLTIYSLCNITDRSWGTREATVSNVGRKSLQSILWMRLAGAVRWMSKQLQTCCRHGHEETERQLEDLVPKTAVESVIVQIQHTPSDVMDVHKWLNLEFGEQLQQQYSDILRCHGYENTMFLSQIEWEDFQDMGIVNIPHMRTLMTGIERLPTFKVSVAQPNDVEEWLNTIGLAMYECGERLEPSDVCDKTKPMEDIAKRLGITKQGHMKRLEYALNCVRHPNKDEYDEQEAKKEIAKLVAVDCANDEDKFWKELLQKCLDPRRETNTNNKELKAELVLLRNRWLQVLAGANVIWLIFIVTLASHAELTVLGVHAIGLILLGIYIFVVMIQFGAMLLHRCHTVIHVLARTSMSCHLSPGRKCCG